MRRINTEIKRKTLKGCTSGEKRVDSYPYQPPSLTDNPDIDLCLWRLAQVLFDIAKSIKKGEEKTTDGEEVKPMKDP